MPESGVSMGADWQTGAQIQGHGSQLELAAFLGKKYKVQHLGTEIVQ